ncbi:AraC family transcriptional regulator [Sulfurimonas sp.]
MTFYTLPQALYTLKGVTPFLYSGNNCILHKILTYDIIDAEALIVSHSIVYVVKGKVQINTPDGKEVIIENGEMFFTPRDSYIISDYLRDGENLEVFLLFFDHDIALSFLGSNIQKSNSSQTVCKLATSKNILYFFEALQKMSFYEQSDKALLNLKILEFLHLVLHENKSEFIATLQASERHKQKRDFTSLMLEHYDKNLTVSDFAALSGRTLSTFNREFKKLHHTTPKQWLIEKKMSKALTLLQDGQTVTQTAFDVGYLNVSNFIKAYKSVYKETPKSMQNNYF